MNELRQTGRTVALQPGDSGYVDAWDRQEDAEGFKFWDALKTLSRWRWLVVAAGLIGVAIAIVTILRTTPLYRASATMEVLKQETQIIEGATIEPLAIADAEFMATQFQLLTSRGLAERIATVLDLANDEHYAPQSAAPERRLEVAAARVQNGLSASIIGQSRIMRVTYVSPYPGEAARIANTAVEAFIEGTLERKYNATVYAQRFIRERLQTTKASLEASERRLVEYAQAEGILDLSSAGGSEIGSSLDATSLTALNAALADAQTRRIDAELRRASLADPARVAALSSPLIDDLIRRRSELASEYNQNLGVMKPDFPEMVRIQSQIASIDQEMYEERQRISSGIDADYQNAVDVESSIRQRIDDLKVALQNLRNRSIDYNILSRDVDTNRSQYEALLQRLKEVSIASGVGTSQVSMVDRAQVPTFPFEPNTKRVLMQWVLLSLAAGIGLAFALEYIDDTIKTPDDVKAKLGLPALGAVPRTKETTPTKALLDDSRSPIAEAIASARTSLQFASDDGVPRSVLITSVRPAEGKTSTATAFGISFARIGLKVLIIDADMRKPSFEAEPEASIGLSGLLTQDRAVAGEVVRGGVENLYLLPCGIIPPNPAELLSSPRLRSVIEQAERDFDLVILDSPPVLGFADALILGGVCEATVLAVQAGAIRRPAVLRALERLYQTHSKVIGVVLTKYKAKKFGYGYGYSYESTYSYHEVQRDRRRVPDSPRKIRLFRSDTGDESVDKAA